MTNRAPTNATSVRVEVLRGLEIPEGETIVVYVYGVEFYMN